MHMYRIIKLLDICEDVRRVKWKSGSYSSIATLHQTRTHAHIYLSHLRMRIPAPSSTQFSGSCQLHRVL